MADRDQVAMMQAIVNDAPQHGASCSTANFAQDAFPGTANSALSLHTDTLGNSWSHVVTADDTILDGSGNVQSQNGSGQVSLYLDSGIPPCADYGTGGTISNLASTQVGLVCRGNATSGGNGYVGTINNFSNVYDIYKLVNGTFTSLQTGGTTSTTGTTTLTFSCVGTTLTLTGTGSGAGSISVTDSTFSAAGKAGLLTQNNGALLGTFFAHH